MIKLNFAESILFVSLIFWPATLFILAILIAISYAYKKHPFGQYSLYFFIVVLIIFSGTALYMILQF
ncbi:hypothetical protein I593_01938 [Acinetobacter tandoii DSM 14970 = CIP 107469]|jgi:cation transport ATPase|uniref:Uncharacterized protein n=1 Tax=Acinetobacter tandoii DSM 14970 = CIP 107469 TaxID=1120927 RepID=R9AXX7_9GAMM|nr:hypothetical protein I593_01938 [Acinetobacter tandoii DSM 14970 = CIP 107469]